MANSKQRVPVNQVVSDIIATQSQSQRRRSEPVCLPGPTPLWLVPCTSPVIMNGPERLIGRRRRLANAALVHTRYDRDRSGSGDW